MRSLIVSAIVAFCGFSMQAQASQTIFYPGKDNAEFSIVAPDDWKLDPAEEAGGFFELLGPTGAQVAMRTISADNESLGDAMTDTVEFLKKNYKDVKAEKTASTEDTYSAVGTGKDKEGHPVVFAMVWTRISKNSVIEMWECVDADDGPGSEQALKVMKSLKLH